MDDESQISYTSWNASHSSEYVNEDRQVNTWKEDLALQIRKWRNGLSTVYSRIGTMLQEKRVHNELNTEDAVVEVTDMIDITTILKCQQFFDAIDRTEFEQIFKDHRQEQSDVLLESLHSKTCISEYFAELIGFFYIESKVIVSRLELSTYGDEKLWDDALLQIQKNLTKEFTDCPDTATITSLKADILSFSLTMESLGCNVAPLYDLLQNSINDFNEKLLVEYCSKFQRDLESDDYAPVKVFSEDEFLLVILMYPVYRRKMEQEELPRVFPYTHLVLKAHLLAQEFLMELVKYTDHFRMNTAAVDDTVRRCANLLLRRWTEILKKFVHKRLSMIQLVQISINLGYLEKSCESLGAFITDLDHIDKIVGASKYDKVAIDDNVYQELKSYAKLRMAKQMKSELDVVLQMDNVDLELPASDNQISLYITKFREYVFGTLKSIDNLPSGLSRSLTTEMFRHIANLLSDSLSTTKNNNISTSALERFSLIMNTCQHFITTRIKGIDQQDLLMTLDGLRGPFNSLLFKHLCSKTRRFLVEDTMMPITLHSKEEFDEFAEKYPYLYKRSMKLDPFPQTIQFSSSVPFIFQSIKKYILITWRNTESRELDSEEVNDMMKHSIKNVLQKVAGILKRFVQKQKSIKKLAQLRINLEFLKKSTKLYLYFITSHQILISEKVFEDVRDEVDKKMYEIIRTNVDEILGSANYDWELSAAADQSSHFIKNLIKFLRTSFESLSSLSPESTEHLCVQIFEHISQSLSDLLLSPETKYISTGALDQFSLDVMQCEMFTTRCPVTGIDPQTLSMTFADLRQLLDLVMSSDWTTLNAEYPRVKASTAIALYRKMIEFEKKSTRSFGIAK